LWIYRVCRPDIGQQVSALGGRISCWNSDCEEQLECLVGYLKETSGERLEFAWPVAVQGKVKEGDVVGELHTDADHRGGDKSQSSFVAWVRHKDYDQGGMCSHWMSKKQTVAADAVSAAEIVAAHLAFKEGLWTLMSLLIALDLNPHTVVLRADNTVCLNHISGRPTDTVYFALKAVDARGAFLTDMYNCGFFQTSHVESHYNRSDVGTKVPGSVVVQEWFRTLVGLLPHRDTLWNKRLQAIRNVYGPAPAELKTIPPDVLAEIRGYASQLMRSIHERDRELGRAFLARL